MIQTRRENESEMCDWRAIAEQTIEGEESQRGYICGNVGENTTARQTTRQTGTRQHPISMTEQKGE